MYRSCKIDEPKHVRVLTWATHRISVEEYEVITESFCNENGELVEEAFARHGPIVALIVYWFTANRRRPSIWYMGFIISPIRS